MAMTGFICHDDYLSKTAKLTDQELGRLFRACMEYHSTGIAPELDGRESVAFDFIKEDIDRAEAAYTNKCEINKQNRLKAIERRSTIVDERKPEPTKEIQQKPTRTKFIKPTLEEVRAYCKERGNSIVPERFIDFYESKGWMVGKNKMKDWKAAVRTWERSRSSGTGKAKPDKPQFGSFSQREYDFDELRKIVSD